MTGDKFIKYDIVCVVPAFLSSKEMLFYNV